MRSLSRRHLAVLALSTAGLVTAGGVATAVGPDADQVDADVTAAALDGIRPAELPTPLGVDAFDPSALAPRPAATPERADRVAEPPVVRTWSGVASWYGPGFAGNRTSNGERFDPDALTAAHKTLPFGSRVRVTFDRTGRSVVVRINDRGPFIPGREIDLSRAAAEAIGLRGAGHGTVTLELLP